MHAKKWNLAEWLTLLWVGFVVLLALTGIYPGYEKTWEWSTNNAANIASWVQAIGSIATIWGAFRIANLQFLEARDREAAAASTAAGEKSERERQERRRKFMLLYDRFHSCTTMAEHFSLELLQSKIGIDIAMVALDDLLSLVNKISFDQVPDLELVVDVSNFRIRLEVLKYQLLSCANSIITEIDHKKNCNSAIEAANEVVRWGAHSRKVCEARLVQCSTEKELDELTGHFNRLNNAFSSAADSKSQH